MNKSIRLLVEGFFDDEIFNTDNDIKSDMEDLGRYYEYKVGEIIYQNKTPYAVCCGESKYFKDNKPRFCLLRDSDKQLLWRVNDKLVKKLYCFKFKDFLLNSFNDFKHIDEDGYRNTLIIKNYYNDVKKFPAFEYCINLGDNIYLPAIDELLMMYLNKDKLGKFSFRRNGYYWSSTLYSVSSAYSIGCVISDVDYYSKYYSFHIRPFFHIN